MTPYELYQFWKQTGDPNYEPNWTDEQSDLIGEIIRHERKDEIDMLVGQCSEEPEEVGPCFRKLVNDIIKDLESQAEQIRQEFYHGAA